MTLKPLTSGLDGSSSAAHAGFLSGVRGKVCQKSVDSCEFSPGTSWFPQTIMLSVVAV